MTDKATPRLWKYREWEGFPVIEFPDSRMTVGSKDKAAYFQQAVTAVNAYDPVREANVKAQIAELEKENERLRVYERAWHRGAGGPP